MSHTPGPWTYNAEGIVLNIRPKGTGWLLATIEEHWLSSQHHDIYANARLIAAAPELLETLAEMVAVFGEWLKDTGGCDHSVGICYCAEQRLIDKADAAIAKAEGKE